MSNCEPLSPLVLELIDMIGKRTTMALLRAAGGQLIYVPRKLTANTKLAQMVGLQATHRMMTRWSGQQIRLPGLAATDRAKRDMVIKRNAAAGQPIDRLAAQNGLTVRQIYNILSR